MKFSNYGTVEEVVWQMVLADIPRGENRSLINALFNGEAPYTEQERLDNNINTNVNFLEGSKLAADARRQFTNAFLMPGNFFNVRVDKCPPLKRHEWSTIITSELNRIMKRSLKYRETHRSTWAQVVLHGIGPKNWPDRHSWCLDAIGVEDVLVPSGTYLTMENLEFFALRRQYTPAYLWKMTHGPKRDPGWNMDIVNKAISKAAEVAFRQGAPNLSEVYSMEKLTERFKEDGTFLASDVVPTVDCWDLYFLNDAGKEHGWNRRMILDFPADAVNSKQKAGQTGYDFIFNPGERNYAEKLSQIMHWQYGDASAVGPFRYHSVRSLGWMLYAVCHLQNRLRCKMNDHAFEALMQLFRVSNPEDRDRLLKVDLHNFGIVPDGLGWVPANERYSPNPQMIQAMMGMNRQSMAENSSAYVQDTKFGQEDKERTATETMAQVQSANAMVSAMLTEAYGYQEFEYMEVCRRFCKTNSEDIDVKDFRARVLGQGVPETVLSPVCWDVEAVRVLGSGNKTLELQQSQLLMQARTLFDPEPQRKILHRFVESTTDDPGLAEDLVPIKGKQVSDATHDAQMSAAAMLMGIEMEMKEGIAHTEYAEALLKALALQVKKIGARGGVGTPDELVGLQNLAGVTIQGQPVKGNGIQNHLDKIAEDDQEKQRVKEYGDVLKKLMNDVKAFAQRLQEQQKAAQQQPQGNGQDPAAMAKVKGAMMMAKVKAQNAAQSHAQRTAQKQIQWEMAERRKAQEHTVNLQKQQREHVLDMHHQARQTQADIEATEMEAESAVRQNRMKSTSDES
jgi:hypothetical protein